MLTFICANCSAISSTPEDHIDSGTTLMCVDCGQETIIDLHTVAQRDGLFTTLKHLGSIEETLRELVTERTDNEDFIKKKDEKGGME